MDKLKYVKVVINNINHHGGGEHNDPKDLQGNEQNLVRTIYRGRGGESALTDVPSQISRSGCLAICGRRGQGDPLSPYIFLFCYEALNRLFGEAERLNHIKGVQVARSAPCISHLLFADDTLAFCEATFGSLQAISHLLDKYVVASGRVINLKKSNMVFIKNVSANDRDHLALALGVRVVDKHDKYLGFPAVGGRSKMEMFAGIHDREWGKIQGWNSKTLS
ncbi:UNVERIFIED_CONTAM: hypothetical protein Sradi_4434000 [Sesamum radiatum]|uniref:Reverse transcriptase domain-containing protein n=1 Tax=Sesamum radiatum TaxID=300843 RepID=A0AAW2NR66_SESRA